MKNFFFGLLLAGLLIFASAHDASAACNYRNTSASCARANADTAYQQYLQTNSGVDASLLYLFAKIGNMDIATYTSKMTEEQRDTFAAWMNHLYGEFANLAPIGCTVSDRSITTAASGDYAIYKSRRKNGKTFSVKIPLLK